ncbi:MAG: glycine zipper 2TM domain-containing protein [Pseudomonadota bacterium]
MNTQTIQKLSARLLFATLLLSMGGCANMSQRDVNTATGAAIGGVAGSVLSGGSAVGTVGGAAVGGVIGREIRP